MPQIVNVSVLVDNTGRQIAVVTDTPKQVMEAIKSSDDWSSFENLAHRQIYVSRETLQTISVIAEEQAQVQTQMEQKILEGVAKPGTVQPLTA